MSLSSSDSVPSGHSSGAATRPSPAAGGAGGAGSGRAFAVSGSDLAGAGVALGGRATIASGRAAFCPAGAHDNGSKHIEKRRNEPNDGGMRRVFPHAYAASADRATRERAPGITPRDT